MDHVILHISDLHVTLYKKLNGNLNSRIESYLTTNDDETAANSYIDAFIQRIDTDFKGKNYLLVVTGDISNSGEVKEFTYSQKFLQRIMGGLKIGPENCLLLPGDHDVHRRSIENALENEPNGTLINQVKYKNFSDLYNVIKKKQFPFNDIIIDYLNVEDRVILLGINSNYQIDNDGGDGFIPIEKFKTELECLKKDFDNPELNYIAFWHHNFVSSHENKNSGQWDPENRKFLLAELERQNIKFVFTGNEHTSNSKAIQMGSITSSDCGAFSTIGYSTSFSAYPIIITDDIIFENKIYNLVKTNGNDLPYFWNPVHNSNAKQPKTFDLYLKNNQLIGEPEELPHHDELDEIVQIAANAAGETKAVYYNNSEKSEKLYSIIREKKLFHSGHFHWSESSRAHNWIDVSKLLEDNNDLYFAQNVIIDVIEFFELADNCDLLIGLGYEGNIISSKASIKFDIPYTSLPYSYRYRDHHEYEKKLNYENKEGKFKKIIIITDVVNDGRTIRELIYERENNFFNTVEKIIVISLFYTGDQPINTDILNYNKSSKDYDIVNDHEINNIEFYTVKSLRVEKCPYGNDYKKECFIYKDDLSCVHLFYDEKDSNDI